LTTLITTLTLQANLPKNGNTQRTPTKESPIRKKQVTEGRFPTPEKLKKALFHNRPHISDETEDEFETDPEMSMDTDEPWETQANNLATQPGMNERAPEALTKFPGREH